MEKPEAEKSSGSEETTQLNRNRSFKSKQLVRSQAIRESQSPPRTASPSVVVDAADVADVIDNDVTTSDKLSSSDANSEDCRRQQVEIQITPGAWEEPGNDQRQRTKQWLGNGNKQHSRDRLSDNPRVECVCGACNACPHCRGRRRKYLCPTKQDSGIVCSDDCPDCSDTEPSGGSNSDSTRNANSVDRDEPTYYCRCPERKEKPKNVSLSRTDSDELSGPELVKFIQDTLNKNSRDRLTLLKIEKELHALINDTSRCIVRFPVMTSYGRMLVHRCAALFQLNHQLDHNSKSSVLVSKLGTCGGRIPCTSFRQWCTASFPPASPQRHHDTTHAKSILKRDTHSLDEPGTGSLSATRSKSLEQREREYERVRRRIFSSDNCSQDESSQWHWLNSGPIKLLTPPEGGRNKLLKVQSLEGSAPNQRSSLSGRGPVSKSHSFGGYARAPDAPRLLSRQGDLASSSWRLSPSSSGYRTLSLHSTDSVTPSPTGGASPEPAPSTEGVAVMWAVTDFSAVPVGALVIHPQTGRPLQNPDGSLYHFDPANPPVIGDASAYTQAETKVDVNGEKKRGRLEKQHSFMDNECECQPSEECKNKCCCECRRHESCHRDNTDKNSTQSEQKSHQTSSPCKTRYEQPVEASTNHNPPPDIPANHRPSYDPATNQKQASDNSTNQRSVYDVSQSYSTTNVKPGFEMRTPYETNHRQFEIQRPPSYEASQKYELTNQRGPVELANHRAMRLTNHGTPEVQYIGQQYQQGYSQEEVTSPQACHQYLQQDMTQHMTQVAPVNAQDPNIRPMSLGMVYPGLTQYYGSPLPVYQPLHSEEQKIAPAPITNNTFTIDPSYPYAPVDYASACCEPAAPPAPSLPAHAHTAPPRPYALYTPIAPVAPVAPVASVEPVMQYQHHYPYQEPIQWQSMQPLVQVPHAQTHGGAHKLFVPELFPLVQYPTPGLPVYPQYNVMYPQMIPQPYPVYQTVQLADKGDQRRNSFGGSHRHSKRNSVSGSSRNTPLTTTPEEKKVPYEETHNLSTIPAQNVSLPSQNQSLPNQNQLHNQNPNVQSQNPNVQSQNPNVSSQNQSMSSQNQIMASHKQNLQSQNSNLPAQLQNSSRDPNDLAAKIKQINEQMSQMHTRERDRDSYKRDGRRDEWKRRNSGNGILGSYPFNGRLVGRSGAGAGMGAGAGSHVTAEEAQLSSAARAIVHSIRSLQAGSHYQDRRPEYNHQYRHDRDKPDYRYRREDKDRADTDRRQLPVYTPSYLLRQMSPGTWCRRSPAPIHPVLNPRRPHPDSRGGRR